VAEHDTEAEMDCNLDIQQCSSAEVYKILKLLPHRDYSSNTKQNDISLIQVDRDINFESREFRSKFRNRYFPLNSKSELSLLLIME